LPLLCVFCLSRSLCRCCCCRCRCSTGCWRPDCCSATALNVKRDGCSRAAPPNALPLKGLLGPVARRPSSRGHLAGAPEETLRRLSAPPLPGVLSSAAAKTVVRQPSGRKGRSEPGSEQAVGRNQKLRRSSGHQLHALALPSGIAWTRAAHGTCVPSRGEPLSARPRRDDQRRPEVNHRAGLGTRAWRQLRVGHGRARAGKRAYTVQANWLPKT
jgi:hypothetical protein